MKHLLPRWLPFLLPLAVLAANHTAARDLWLDMVRDVHPWMLAMVRDEVFAVALMAALLYCTVALVVHWFVVERPADKRKAGRA